MKVCIIRPPILVPVSAFVTIKTPPIGAAYICSTIREAGHDVQLIDGLGEAVNSQYDWDQDTLVYGLALDKIVQAIDPEVDLIGFNLNFSFEWPLYRKLISMVGERFPKATIISGGEHTNAVPHQILNETCISVCIHGEGEETILDIIECLDKLDEKKETLNGISYLNAKGEFIKNPPRMRIKNLNDIAWPAWDLVPMEEYLSRSYGHGIERGRSMPILASRGCPYQCTFCSNPGMWTTRWNIRTPDDVIAEIKDGIKRFRAENFDFYDLTAVVKKDWIVEFCTKLIDQDLNITWQLPSGTRSEAIDGEVARLMYKSGCRNLSYAPESGSERILELIKKKVKLSRMLKSMSQAKKAGLILKVNIIIGFPDERLSDIVKTIFFSARMAMVGVHDYSMFIFSPYPGTELYDQLEKDGKVQLDDEFYDSLRTYTDVNRTYSFSKRFTGKQLKAIRAIGTATFYGTSFLLYPHRPFKMLFNVFFSKHLETRTEKGVLSILNRFGLMQKS